MKKLDRLTRRTLLRGTLAGSAVALPLPLLNCLLSDNGTAMAGGGALPKRFGVWWWGNGVRISRWVPAQTGAGYTLSEELQSMADVQDDITVVSESRCPVDGFAHHSGHAGMLTGDSLERHGDDSSTFRQKSIDVLISEAWAGQAPFDLINLAVHRDPRFERGTPGHVSFNGTSFNPNEVNPGAAYDRLFGGDSPVQMMPQDDGTAEARARARSRALDAVLEDSAALQSALGVDDRARVEQHLDGLRELQTRIQQFEAAAPAIVCPEVARPDYNEEPSAVGRISEKHQLMADLFATAFACNVTRVATLMHHTWYGVSFPESGVNGEQHGLTHNEGGDQPQVHQTVTFVMSNLAAFFRTLKAMPEGDGSLLDNCLIYCTSEVSEGNSHSKDRMPIILGGGAGGRLVRGQHLSFPNVSSFRVVMSLFQALEVDIPSFGVNQWTETEPLSELLV
jgi:hypothetical protein